MSYPNILALNLTKNPEKGRFSVRIGKNLRLVQKKAVFPYQLRNIRGVNAKSQKPPAKTRKTSRTPSRKKFPQKSSTIPGKSYAGVEILAIFVCF